MHKKNMRTIFTIFSISKADLRYLLAGTSFLTETFEPNCPKLRSLNPGSKFSGTEMAAIFCLQIVTLRHWQLLQRQQK